MSVSARSVISLVGAMTLVLGACTGGDDGQSTEEVRHLWTTRLDLPVDRVLGAFDANDLPSLIALLEFSPRGCVEQPGDASGVRCLDGESEGDLVEVFTWVGCHGEAVRRADVAERMTLLLRSMPALHAIAEQAPATVPPIASYLIFLSTDSGPRAVGVSQAGEVTYIDEGCGVTSVEELTGPRDAWLLAPLVP